MTDAFSLMETDIAGVHAAVESSTFLPMAGRVVAMNNLPGETEDAYTYAALTYRW